jgi:hypothetical protein
MRTIYSRLAYALSLYALTTSAWSAPLNFASFSDLAQAA